MNAPVEEGKGCPYMVAPVGAPLVGALIACAREWLGTPYHHQAAVKGRGADCVGFLKGVAVEARVISPDLAAELPTDYSRQPSGQQLRRLLGQHLTSIPIAEARPGDIVLMRFAREDQHVAMLTIAEPQPYIIHCGPRGVVEHRLDSVWRGSITRAYRFPAIEQPCSS